MATTITQTTLAAPVKTSSNILNVVSATNFVAPTNGYLQQIYVINPDSQMGELMSVVSISGTYITVSRLGPGFKQVFVGPSGNGGLGAVVLIAPPVQVGAYQAGPYLGGFQDFDPVGNGSEPMVSGALQPWINVNNGNQWLYSSVLGMWVPGFNNTQNTKGVCPAVASAAGLITPSGPLFHITGALAITGFNLPVGFTGGTIVIIPDGAFTTTNANNIAIASTGVVSKQLIYQYDSNTGKFYPSY